MDIFASLGYATDHPSPDFLKRKPEPRNASIISITMWKMIICQAIYQLTVVFVVHYAGWDTFNPDTEFEIEKLQTLVLNIYVSPGTIPTKFSPAYLFYYLLQCPFSKAEIS